MFLNDTNKASDLLIPWCTYTDPEIAHVGKYESDLIKDGIEYELYVRQLKDVDRCMCDGITNGFVKIIIKAGTSQIIGATICAVNAGDMISELTICIQYGIKIHEIAGTIHPYPTTQESIRQACLGYNKYFKNPTAAPLTTLRKLMAKIDNNDEN
jgi:pyruvate/2-oxoglutarate dehydrogenase complex dihydrolipoamide dehydrogenase (E3) component